MNRRGGREFALHLLYQMELRGDDLDHILPGLLDLLDPTPEDRSFGVRLVEHAVSSRTNHLERLTRQASNWDPSRFAILDRCVLLLAMTELTSVPETPTAVVLDEAIELAKAYSTEQSGKFVNGLLDPLAHELRPQAPSLPSPENLP